ncbi:hypothetical protein BDV59DRAFT_204808 [Aspergillus ambiguus]|uniref:uncharacterized protein n=1 Tax=Aspergillus ambiguus TaxID=176160 RepID=UPI003CCD0274
MLRLSRLSLSLSLVLSLFLLLLRPVHADDDTTLVPQSASDSFPQCGLSCSALNSAQSLCIPPTAPANGRATYVTCFCQSNLLTQLKTSPDGTCDDVCSNESDRALLQKWFSDFCSSGGSLKSTADSSDANSENSDNSNQAAATAASTATANARKNTPAPQSWWSGHYQWVVMVIVLIIGFAVLTVLGVWLKRRHDAKYPGLYHGASGSANNSGMLFARPNNLSPGPVDGSLGSSSRTDVVVPKVRPSPSGSRLQKGPPPTQGGDDLEIREVR